VSSNSEYVATGSRNGRIVVVLGQTGAVHAILKVGRAGSWPVTCWQTWQTMVSMFGQRHCVHDCARLSVASWEQVSSDTQCTCIRVGPAGGQVRPVTPVDSTVFQT
jgi:hypothetical protein